MTSAYTRDKNSQQVNTTASITPPNPPSGTQPAQTNPDEPGSSGEPATTHDSKVAQTATRWSHDPYAVPRDGRFDARNATDGTNSSAFTYVQDASATQEVIAYQGRYHDEIGYLADGSYGWRSGKVPEQMQTIYSRYTPIVCDTDKHATQCTNDVTGTRVDERIGRTEVNAKILVDNGGTVPSAQNNNGILVMAVSGNDRGGKGSDSSDGRYDAQRTQVFPGAVRGLVLGEVAGVEAQLSVGGDPGTHTQRLHRTPTDQRRDLVRGELCGKDKVVEEATLPSGHAGPPPRLDTSDGSIPGVVKHAQEISKTDNAHNDGTATPVTGVLSGTTDGSHVHQGRINDTIDGDGGKRAHPGKPCGADGEASGRHTEVAGHDSPIRSEQGSTRNHDGVGSGNGAPVTLRGQTLNTKSPPQVQQNTKRKREKGPSPWAPLLGNRRTKTHVPRTPEERAAKLHSQKIPTMSLFPVPDRNVEGIIKVLKDDPELPELLKLWRYNVDASATGPYAKVPTMTLLEHQTSKDMTMEEIKILESNKQLTSTTWDEVKAVGVMFKHHELKVNEETQEIIPRNRVVTNPEHINKHVEYKEDTENMDLQTLRENIAQMQPGDWCCVGDLQIGFNQMELTKEVGAYHCIRAVDGTYWRQLVSTMGFGPNSAIMDKLTKMLARLGLPENVRMTTHVDGVRFLANNDPDAVQLAMTNFKENLRRCGGTMKDEPTLNKPHQKGVWCGVLNNYILATTCLPPKGEKKLAKVIQILKQPKMTVADAFEAYGYLYFASAVLQAPLCEYYFPLKWYRRIASEFTSGRKNMEDLVRMWDSIRVGVNTWTQFLTANTPTAHNLPGIRPATLYTDASLKGWGAVLFIDGMVYVCGGGWTVNEARLHINVLEAEALLRGVTRFKEHLHGARILLKIDNTSVIGAMVRGYSTSFEFNAKIGAALHSLRGIDGSYIIEYVQSAMNLSDGESRRHEIGERTSGLGARPRNSKPEVASAGARGHSRVRGHAGHHHAKSRKK